MEAEAEAGKDLKEIRLEETQEVYNVRAGNTLTDHLIQPAHLTKRETETQRQEVACPESHSDLVAENGAGTQGPVKQTAALKWKSWLKWRIDFFLLLEFWDIGLVADASREEKGHGK